jgi:hypothetical protein
MQEVLVVPLATLQADIKAYAGKKVSVAELLFFYTSTMVYANYYLQIGPQGGVTVHHGKGTTTLKMSSITEGSVESGITYTYGADTRRTVGLPPMKDVPKLLMQFEKEHAAATKQYETTYLRSKARLDSIKELVEKYPEYSL